MKTLRLQCSCGAVQVFKGPDVNAILRQIDESLWVENQSAAPKGTMHGECPECLRLQDCA